MISERFGGHSTIENMVVTHRWCYEKYRSINDYDTLPDNPERYLSTQERIVDGQVVWQGGKQSRGA
jgi:RNA-directed DNA polymerase